MCRVSVALCGILVVVPQLWPTGASSAEQEKPQTPDQQYEALVSQFFTEYSEFSRLHAKATPAEMSKLQSPNAKFGTRMMELADKNPDDPAAVRALGWVVRFVQVGPDATRAVQLITGRYLASKHLGAISQDLHYSASPMAPQTLRTIWEKSPHRDVQGVFGLALAQYLKDKAGGSSAPSQKTEKMTKEAEALFERLVKDYADVKMNDVTVADLAKRELFELRHLAVGQAAPSIEAEDMDGKRLKLSDYRGKVTLLACWASWCSPCMHEVPRERALVERFRGRPFALLGLNGDFDRAKAKEAMAGASITWPSFWNGPKGPEGPLTQAWNVRNWPTYYLFDHQGVIRAKCQGAAPQEMDDLVEELVKEAEAARNR
jgi:thiol-disulfide isomerase/thioredoxin